MVRKIASAVILIPLALLIVSVLVANRATVTVSYDPFGAVDPAMAFHVRLFVLVLALLIAGVIVCGIASWITQRRWRRAARRLQRELAAARAENDRLRDRIAAAEAPHPLSLRPPAA